MRKSLLNRLLFSLALLGLAPASPAVPPAQPISIETLAKHPSFRSPRLSPNGRYLATLIPIGNRSNLAVIDLDTMKATPITGFDSIDVGEYLWVNNSRLVFKTVDLKAGSGVFDQYDSNSGGIYAVNREGGPLRTLVLPVRSQHQQGFMNAEVGFLLGIYREDGDEVILSTAKYDDDSVRAYRVNTTTGRRVALATDVPSKVTKIVLDAHREARALLTHNKEQTRNTLWLKPPSGSTWIKLEEFDNLSPEALNPVGFSPDGSTLYVLSSRGGRNTTALFAYDTEKHQLGEQLVAHPQADIHSEDIRFSTQTHELLGLRVDPGEPQTVWFSGEWERIQQGIDKVLPERENTLTGNPDGRVLVFSRGKSDAGKIYLYDTPKATLTEILRPYPDIGDGTLSATRFIRYSARDGLSIPAYLTIPQNSSGKKLPLVVLVHGGPWVRDHSGYNPEVQLLASRGYAVLQPQFRGSTGFGNQLFYKSFKQWGLAMQDDLDDGVDHLAKQGVIDPSRVAIMGASYGGFAVLSALSRTPGRYRCGIDIVGVSDPSLVFSISWSDAAGSEWLKHRARDMIGDPERDAELFARVSPLRNAKSIRAPVLMAYGEDDRRVPLPHGTKMRDALLDNGNTVRWLSFLTEGHGFLIPANREKLYSEIESFLATNMAPR